MNMNATEGYRTRWGEGIKSWEDIKGWYDFASAYEQAVDHFPPGETGVFVEVGCFLGKSLCHLGKLVKDSGKSIKVIGVDTCRGSGEENGRDNHVDEVRQGGGTFAGELHRNIHQLGLTDIIDLLIAPSVRAASYFADNSLDMVFLDAGHDFASVVTDIRAWTSKVKSGGWIGGDDFGIPSEPTPIWPEVRQAVMQEFGHRWEPWSHDSWRVKL